MAKKPLYLTKSEAQAALDAIGQMTDGNARKHMERQMTAEFRFEPSNTEGYSAPDLVALNAAWDEITRHGSPANDSDDPDCKSLLDHWAEQLLSAYDDGLRGEELTAWFYES